MSSLLTLPLLLAGAVQSTDPPAPLPPLPSERQLRWHELGYYAFVHFGMNTFTDVEWGHGREDPDAFAPSALDCRQWARVCRAAGMKGILLTAKHHDGFCLWPSEATAHTVAASAWRDGAGDVLAELSSACREEGLLFGVYLSPWDRNHPAYGDSPRYNEVFVAELREVLSGYGPVFEVWFDGACGEGPNGKLQEYDWPAFVEVVRELQPDACIFSDAGPDVRWVGNERGEGGETNWCLLRRDEVYPGYPDYHELTEGHADGTHWVPAECNTSIRPGWYYHPDEDGRVKRVEELLETWYASVGRGANFLLNLPVDRRGLVHEVDAARLTALRRVLDATFANDLARGRPATASAVRGGDLERFGPARALDGDPATYWAVDDETTGAAVAVQLGAPTLVDQVLLSEAIALGQRVEAFSVRARTDGEWREVARGTTVGAQRVLRFPALVASAVEVRIEAARACPTLARLELYCAPPRARVTANAAAFLSHALVAIEADQPDTELYFTLDGSAPTADATRYRGAFRVEESCTVRALAVRAGVESLVPAELALRSYAGVRMHPALQLFREPDRGPAWIAYEGTWQRLDEMLAGEPVARGVADGLDVDLRTRAEHAGLRFQGFLRVPMTGVYELVLASDDGSRLFVDGELVVDNDGVHGLRAERGATALEAGWHGYHLDWFNVVGGGELELRWVTPGGEEEPLPTSWLGH